MTLLPLIDAKAAPKTPRSRQATDSIHIPASGQEHKSNNSTFIVQCQIDMLVSSPLSRGPLEAALIFPVPLAFLPCSFPDKREFFSLLFSLFFRGRPTLGFYQNPLQGNGFISANPGAKGAVFRFFPCQQGNAAPPWAARASRSGVGAAMRNSCS